MCQMGRSFLRSETRADSDYGTVLEHIEGVERIVRALAEHRRTKCEAILNGVLSY